MELIKSAVKHPVTTTLVFVACMILGVFSLSKISIAQFPEMEANVIMVMSSYQGASAEDIETNVSKVLENSLNGVSDLKEITSQSKENVSILMLEFEHGVDIDEATNDVRDKLDMVSSALPDGASLPVIFKFSADDMPIMILSATADESLPGLDKILEDRVTTNLARVKGVGTVSVNGAPSREIQVYCDPNKLQAHGLSITTISSILSSENRNIPSGSIDIGSNTYSLRVEGEFNDPSELLDVVVGSYNGRAIYLRDVATVRDGSEEKEMESYTNGIRSAQIVIQKQSGSNTVNVIKEVKKQMEIIKADLPTDIHIETVVDSSDNIINTINTLKETIAITFFVVMLVVFVFLRSWKSTFIIVLSIPVALLASLVYLFATGNTLNIVSMSALSIAIGMVVDDAIVVLENISSHIERGERPKEAAIHATTEVGISVIASTLTMLCVFIPITMIGGMAGVIFNQLGWIVSIIMTVSTVAALTLVPMLCSVFMKSKKKNDSNKKDIFEKALDSISNGYGRLIEWALTHRKTVIFSSIAVFALVVGLLGPKIKTEFFPQSDQGRMTVSAQLPQGTAQEITGEVARSLYERICSEVPEIVISSYNFGQADSENALASMNNNGSNVISMTFNLGSMEDRERSTSEIADITRDILREYPEINKATVSEGGGGMGGASSINIEIYGYDFEATDAYARRIQAKLLEDPAFTEVTLSRDEYVPQYQMEFDRTKLAMNGLNSSTAGSAFSAAMSGSITSYYREDGDEYNIRVRYAPEYRQSVEDIENVVITNAAGKPVRMKELGSVVESMIPPTIVRRDRERVVTVTALVSRESVLSDAVLVAQNVLEAEPLPSTMSAVITGDYEEQQEMFADMFLLIVLIILLVYMVMASQFESFSGPLVIMVSVPFALVGVILGLWATNIALGMMAMVGVIILLGIVVKNGIVLIDYTILCRERGMSIMQASIVAAKSRLRPILMTTLTTVLGMLPMAIGKGEGAELWRSLGMTVCWGLTISSVITLVLIPTIYCVFITRIERRKKSKQIEKV